MSRRLKILHVNKLYAPWIGGIENVVQVLAEEAAGSSDLDVRVLVCQPRGASCEEEVNGVRVTRVGSAGMWMSTPLAPSFPFVLRRLRREADVVHLHVPFPLPMFAGWTEPANSRLVIHYHCDLSRPGQRAIMRALNPWHKPMFERADRFVVSSDNLVRHAAGLRGFEERCSVIPLPLHIGAAEPLPPHRRAEVRTRLGLAPTDRVVLFVGRLVYYKGLEYLLDAMPDVAAKLLVVGDGPLRASIDQRIDALALRSRVRLLGHVDDAELHTLYEIADVFAFPSIARAEAFGLVQVEAMAHGCPVVNTDLPTGVPSVSLHQQTGLTVPPCDTPALVRALNAILSDTAMRRRFSDNSRVRAREFDRRAVAEKVKDLYFEVCGRPTAKVAKVA